MKASYFVPIKILFLGKSSTKLTLNVNNIDKNKFMYFYKAYSLVIASELEIPWLPVSDNSNHIGLHITMGETPKKLMGPNILTKVRNQSAPGKFLIINPIANFYISNGNKIVIEVKENNEWDFIRHYVLSRCIAAIARQRNWIPIHASAINVNGKAVLFAGNSGAGKSTTASFFIKKGYGFIADDICIINKATAGSRHQIIPAYPNIRMWEDTFSMIGSNGFQKGNPVRKGIAKYNIHPLIDFYPSPLPISNIYILRPTQCKHSFLESINKINALQHLLQYTYAKGQMDGLGGKKEQFETFSQLIKNSSLKIINRSLLAKDPNQLLTLIENDFLKKND